MSNLLNRIPFISVISSAPQSGKSTLVKYMLTDLFSNKKLNYGLVFCPSAFDGGYSFLPEKYVYLRFDEDAVKNLMKIQMNQIKTNGSAKPAFIIMDDCIGSVNFQSKFISELITNFRHYNITIIICTQYIRRLPPTIHECCSYFFTFNQTSFKSITGINEIYMEEKKYDECSNFIRNNCKDYHFILVKTYEPIEKKYTISKCPIFKNIKINY